MFYEQDWLGRQIQMLVRFVAKTVFKKDTDEFTELIEKSASGADILYKELLVFLQAGEICKAENHLYDSIDAGNRYHFAVAVEFYSLLNKMSDEELEKGDFSREEIKDGLKNVSSVFGVGFADEFLD